MRKRLLIVFAAAALIAGCGGDDEPEAATSADDAVSDFLAAIQAEDATAACAVITDSASEIFATEAGGGASTEPTGTTCADNLSAEALAAAAEYEAPPGDLKTEPGDSPEYTNVDVELLGETSVELRFSVKESEGEFTIVSVDNTGSF